MNRSISSLLFASLLLAGAVASADERPAWQETAEREGLTAAAAELKNYRRDPEAAFARGAVETLRSFEGILQARYQNYTGRLPFVPGMSRAIAPNPNARFDPAFIELAMEQALERLDSAERALEVATRSDLAVVIDIDDLWLDIDGDGVQSANEGLPIVLQGLGRRNSAFDGRIRFDRADADWLKAWVHATSALAELVLSVDPTPGIERVVEGRRALERMGVVRPSFAGPEQTLEIVASTLLALRGTPDARRTRAAHQHFVRAIAHNRAFWQKVELEEDNDREWLPNARQSSAFGVPVSAEMAENWQGVLDEFEAIIEGELLLPYWRVQRQRDAPAIGVNLKRVLTEPGDMDLVLWIQGAAAAPYLEEGRVTTAGAWRRFAQLAGGEAFLFALWLN